MCRRGQEVVGNKNMINLSFFSPSQLNSKWTPKVSSVSSINLSTPSASERMVPFFIKEIMPFFDTEAETPFPIENDNASAYIKEYSERGE